MDKQQEREILVLTTEILGVLVFLFVCFYYCSITYSVLCDILFRSSLCDGHLRIAPQANEVWDGRKGQTCQSLANSELPELPMLVLGFLRMTVLEKGTGLQREEVEGP